jgi:hypothetical protein
MMIILRISSHDYPRIILLTLLTALNTHNPTTFVFPPLFPFRIFLTTFDICVELLVF